MTFRYRLPGRQGGIAAIELAIIVCMTFFLVPLLLVFARVLWSYSVLRAASHDAARYFATAAIHEMAGAGRPAIELQAREILMDDMAAGGLEQLTSSSDVLVSCSAWGGMCAGFTEGQVTVLTMGQVSEPDLGAFLENYLNAAGAIQIPISSTVPYAGRPLDK